MTEPTHLLTVHTLDQRGIIANLSEVLESQGARLLELSQTVVRDYFTIIIIAALPPDTDTQTLSAQLHRIIGAGAAVNLLPYQTSRAPVPDSDRYILTALGDDSPGVVHSISSLIAERGGNFLDLDCRVVATRIRLVAEIELPPSVALDQLQIDLEHAGQAAGLQVRLQHQHLFQATNQVLFRRISR